MASGAVVVHRARGRFGDVFVVDERGRRHLRFGSASGSDQSVVDLRAPELLMSVYHHAIVVGAVLAEPIERILLIGLGGGGFARFALRFFPEARIEAIEIDPLVARLARRYFGVRSDPRLSIEVDDAVRVLSRTAAGEDRYELIVLDAYCGAEIPAPLARREFLEQVRRSLSRRGIAVANVGLPDTRAEDALLARIASVFRARCFEVRNERDDNRVAIASRGKLPGARELLARIEKVDASGRFPFPLAPIARTRRPCPRPRAPREGR
jgi:spermidine synthase